MDGRLVRRAEEAGCKNDPEDLDERTRLQYLAVLQYLQAHGLFDALGAMERETRVHYEEGDLPVASVLEASLDMFAHYRKEAAGELAATAAADEEQLQRVERGVCCTGPCPEGAGCQRPLNANVTAVAWATACAGELFALAASADRRLRLLGPAGEVLAELSGLASPVLGLDVSPSAEEVLATAMGGEAMLVRLQRPMQLSEGDPEAALLQPGSGWALEVVQRFRDHTKHATSGRFAPPAEDSAVERHPPAFVTVSRDHQARLYLRAAATSGVGSFTLAGTVRLAGEVTCCCWASARTFVLAARDDHNLHYCDVDGGANGEPVETLKTNLNVLRDSVVSFVVLAMAASPDRRLLAACTDKSRIIIMRMFTDRQLRNLYGAVIDEYDVPSVCFSLDQSFIYATSSLPQRALQCQEEEDGEEPSVLAMCGEVVVFEVRTGEAVLRLPCHEKAVRCMARHPLAECLVTGSFDKTVKYWA